MRSRTLYTLLALGLMLLPVLIYGQQPAPPSPGRDSVAGSAVVRDSAARPGAPGAVRGAAPNTPAPNTPGAVRPATGGGEAPMIVNIKGRRIFPVKVMADSTALAFVGGVVFYHNGAVILCDSAVRYNENLLECFDNVLINKDSTYVYGDRALYDRSANLAQVFSPLIKMIDGRALLYTYNFTFNTLTKVGEYYGGGTIAQDSMLLESDRGYYYADTRDAVCVGNAELREGTYLIRTDSLGYNMNSEVATFYQRTHIWNEKGEILSADKGWYYPNDGRYHFTSGAYVMSAEREVWADDMEYFEASEDVTMRRNVQVRDEGQQVLGFGDYAQYWGERGDALLTEKPSVIYYGEGADSLYMRADSMFLYVIDSTSVYSANYKAPTQARPATGVQTEELVRPMGAADSTGASLVGSGQADAGSGVDTASVNAGVSAGVDSGSMGSGQAGADLGSIGTSPVSAAVINDTLSVVGGVPMPESGGSVPTVELSGSAVEQNSTAVADAARNNTSSAGVVSGEQSNMSVADTTRGAADSVASQSSFDDLRRRERNALKAAKDSVQMVQQAAKDSLRRASKAMRDSVRTVQRAEKDSVRMVRRAEKDARRAVADSIRSARDAERDALRARRDSIRAAKVAASERRRAGLPESATTNEAQTADSLGVQSAAGAGAVSGVGVPTPGDVLSAAEALVLAGAGIDGQGDQGGLPGNRETDEAGADGNSEGGGAVITPVNSDSVPERGMPGQGEVLATAEDDSDSAAQDDVNGVPDGEALGAQGIGGGTLNGEALGAEAADSLAGAQATEPPAEEEKERVVLGYHDVKIYRSDVQGICDSLIAYSRDTTVHMHRDPVLWNGESQIKSDLTVLYTKNEQLDRAVFSGGDPLMSTRLDEWHYNQVTGKTIEAYFRDNDIYKTDVVANAQTFYYMQDEKTHEYQGFLVMTSADITFSIAERAVQDITFRGSPVYAIYPMDKIPETQPREFPNFVWQGESKPTKQEVHDRDVKPSRREEYTAMPQPAFPLTDRISSHRERMMSDGIWSDRSEDITPDALDFKERMERQGGVIK